MHCHQVKERQNAALEKAGKWSRDLLWRYPPPDNLGLVLEIDRGNVIARVEPGSPAARAGLRAGDVVRRLNGLPVHSFATDRANNLTAAKAASAGKTEVGGTLKIQVEGAGAKVTELTRAGNAMDIDVTAGLAMM